MLGAMERTPISSSALASVAYDVAARELEVEFQSGRVYRYRDVPQGAYEFLLRARHKGSYFNRMIANRYAYDEVREVAPEQDVLAALRASLECGPRTGR